MSEQATDTAVVNAEAAGTGDINAQLDQMRESEGGAQTEGQQQEGQQGKPEGEEGQQSAAQKQVPLAALHEARNETRALRQQIAQRDRDHAEALARVDQRLQALFQPRQQVPDKIDAPVDYLDQKIDGIAQRQDAIIRHTQEQQALAQRQQQFHAVVGAVNYAESEFKKAAPDFDAGVQHLNDVRARELMVLGAPEDQARQQAEMELAQASLAWAAQGRNPAHTAYELAKTKGYTPRANTEQRMETQQRGTAAAKSLGGGGAVNGGRLTAEALAKMSDEDFSKLTESQFRQAMGG